MHAPQWMAEYLDAYQAANGRAARLEPTQGGYLMIDENDESTGIVYAKAEIIQRTARLRERAAIQV